MPNDFLTDTLPVVVVIAANTGIASYAAYLAFSVWRGLAVPIYKSRALWTGFLAIMITVALVFSGNVNAIFPGPYAFIASVVVYFGVYTVALIAIFSWIDRTIGTMIRTDFLRRDFLKWSRFRYVFWTSAVLAIIFNALYPQSPPFLFVLLSTVFLLVPIIYGAIALVLGSAKTRDMTFRAHLKWGGFCLLAILLTSLVYYATPNVAIQDLPAVLISFCLFKMAKNLVPVSTLEAPGPTKGTVPVAPNRTPAPWKEPA